MHPISKDVKEFIEENISLMDNLSQKNLYKLFENATFNLRQPDCDELMDILRFTLEVDSLYDDYIYPWILYIFNTSISNWENSHPLEYNHMTLVEVLEESYLFNITYDMDRNDQYHLCGIIIEEVAQFILEEYKKGHFNGKLIIEESTPYLGALDITILR